MELVVFLVIVTAALLAPYAILLGRTIFTRTGIRLPRKSTFAGKIGRSRRWAALPNDQRPHYG